mmetsp:Transcript_21667/g.60227  ORF Transcript_21667/g.60227 Transcript_21667/m.60227 type:complete len:235 (-) Transcript_21667:78-782(-)
MAHLLRWVLRIRQQQVQALKAELVYFGRFHRHYANKSLHVIFVPLEWFSVLLAVKAVCTAFGMPLAAAAAAVLSVLYYSALDATAGISWAPIQVLLSAAVEHTFVLLGFSGALLAAAAVQAVSWTGQVCVGHWLIEMNQPGMATGLTAAAVLLSPLLVWYDVLWSVGVRQDLWRQVEREISCSRINCWKPPLCSCLANQQRIAPGRSEILQAAAMANTQSVISHAPQSVRNTHN